MKVKLLESVIMPYPEDSNAAKRIEAGSEITVNNCTLLDTLKVKYEIVTELKQETKK